ncbi:rCG61618 [Rattus norvegicus]|uniref:RCG61618 n=1 Tax=Rattus norvegicus TaxID=10116 RepID=A6HBF0_RAT|nr:rCG61618 [Rattus norvegicus]
MAILALVSMHFLVKGPVNIFNKIIEENFPNLKKEIPIGIQEAYRTPNRLDQKRNTSRHIIVKTPNAQNKERILKAVREKGQVTYKSKFHTRQSYTMRQRIKQINKNNN